MNSIHTLEADSIRKGFKGRLILSDVYLSCRTNETVGILGRNGAGKSTLLRIIFGELDTPNKILRFDGRNYDKPFLKSGLLAYLPQESMLPANTSIRRIIRAFVPIHLRNDLLEDERIAPHIGKKITQLSGGERKYLEIRMILTQQKKFILLDEPFTGVEPIYKEIIIALIREAQMESGIIISDHDFRNVIAVSNRLYLINEGVCREVNDLVELERNYYLPVGTVERDNLNLKD